MSRKANPPRWEILIPTIPHRHDKLVALLDTLAPQIRDGVGVLVYRDNLEQPYGPKCQALADAATADYTSFLSDDDSVSPDFVTRILEALEDEPDHVGFRIRYTEGGAQQVPVVHSLQFPDWANTATLIYRDMTHFEPMRRELMTLAPFTGHEITDRDWADAVRASGRVKTEAFIDAEILYYQHTLGDYILTQRSPMPADDLPVLPDYPFVRYIDPVSQEA